MCWGYRESNVTTHPVSAGVKVTIRPFTDALNHKQC